MNRDRALRTFSLKPSYVAVCHMLGRTPWMPRDSRFAVIDGRVWVLFL